MTAIQLKILLAIYLSGGVVTAKKLLVNYSYKDVKNLENKGLITPCGRLKAYYSVAGHLDARLDSMISDLAEVINAFQS